MDAAFNPEKKRDNYPILVSREVELKPGASYRLRARLRSDSLGCPIPSCPLAKMMIGGQCCGQCGTWSGEE